MTTLIAWLVVPAAIVAVVALVTRGVLRSRGVSSPGRVGAAALASGALLATVIAVIALVNLDGYEVQCDESTSRWPLGIAYYLALLLGGIAIGGTAADKTRVGRLLARHVLVGAAAVVGTLVLVVEVLFVGLSCYYR
jgi:uncharacterized integral membrane protein